MTTAPPTSVRRPGLLRRGWRRGMTLIEIIVVMVIVAAMFGASIAVFDVLGASDLQAEAGRLASTMEYIYGRSAINGQRYQLVIDLDENAYWAECSEEDVALPAEMASGIVGMRDGAGTLTTGDGRERASDRFADMEARQEAERYAEDDEEADPFGLNLENAFDDCTDHLIPRRELREGVVVTQVMTTHQLIPFEEGQDTIAFFPNGFVEPSIIWLADEDGSGRLTLFVDPMTGRVKIERGESDVPNDFLEVEEDR